MSRDEIQNFVSTRGTPRILGLHLFHGTRRAPDPRPARNTPIVTCAWIAAGVGAVLVATGFLSVMNAP